MKHVQIAGLVGVAVLLLSPDTQPIAQAIDPSLQEKSFWEEKSFRARLTGYQEPPAISSTGSGEFHMTVSGNEPAFEYRLSYQDLEGNVTQAHIHFAQKGVNGGISVWLCGTTSNPGPTGTPTCPTPSGTITGTVSAANVIGPEGQGIAAGEFEELLKAIRKGVTYANVHSSRNTGGEIRGQIHRGSVLDRLGIDDFPLP